MRWYDTPVDEVFSALDTQPNGLTSDEVERRRAEHGENLLRAHEGPSALSIFVSQFSGFLVILLVAAALLSLGVGLLPGQEPEYTDAALIFLILVGNGVFGFVQDYRAEQALTALRDLSAPTSTVRRDDEIRQVDARELVPGDIVILAEGTAVPADARLVEAPGLQADESLLTGESESVAKRTDPDDTETSLAERLSMVYAGTTVVRGRAEAVVVATGMETELGAIASQLEVAEERETPFEREIDRLGRRIGIGVIALILVVAATQLFVANTAPVLVLLVAVTLAVAAVPEGLPAVVTFTLALGAREMAQKNALVRTLGVVESLGSVDVVVTDKTGTLTENRMTVSRIGTLEATYQVSGTGLDPDGEFRREGEVVEPYGSALEQIIRCGAVCNDAAWTADGVEGDPTEVALLVAAAKAGLDGAAERRDEVPFTAERRLMTVVTEDGTAWTKGAPEEVLDRCTTVLVDGDAVELTPGRRERIEEKATAFAGDALRVLGFARRTAVDGVGHANDTENEMTFLGLQGMRDPPRSGVRDAIADCHDAGVRVVMATGDDPRTGRAIATEVGLAPGEPWTGRDVEAATPDELAKAVATHDVFARVAPNHKVSVLDALQAQGHTVAMTGDGVNDAPALRSADVGISMGKRGTQVAREASDMVLQDDNFVTIRDAIAAGRGIFDNIRKFVEYLLSANAGEVLVVFLGVLVGAILFPEQFTGSGQALILTPVMLLWINLVTDGLPALALGADPTAADVMDRPPRPHDEGVLTPRTFLTIGSIALLMAATGLPLFFGALVEFSTVVLAQTLLFTFLVTAELVRAQVVRREYGLDVLSNPWLLGALALSLSVHLAILYTPLSAVFEVIPLDLVGWQWVVIAFVVFLVGNFTAVRVLGRLFE